jgi:RNA polymerase sigma factor (sigma-70 family)
MLNAVEERALQEIEARELLRERLSHLSDFETVLLILYGGLDWTLEELAGLTGLSRQRVWQIIDRARRKANKTYYQPKKGKKSR